MLKVITFAQEKDLDLIIDAMFQAGAGNMGNYSHTCFITKGKGNWFSKEGADPAIGAVGQMSRVQEYKIEMFCPEEFVDNVIAEILKVHPYEKPEIDVIKINFYTK